ncbi:MAG: hypothetical protein U0176_11935 [Bacteroidia bacterium]
MHIELVVGVEAADEEDVAEAVAVGGEGGGDEGSGGVGAEGELDGVVVGEAGIGDVTV